MKKLSLIVFATIGILCSCTDNDTTKSKEGSEYVGKKWKLVKMTGNTPNSETTGEDMNWQEYYTFYEDSTFIKSRTYEGKTTEASGTYSFVTEGDENFIKLVYPEDHELIGNCFNTPEELLWIFPDKLKGIWEMCDGPGLIYEREQHSLE